MIKFKQSYKLRSTICWIGFLAFLGVEFRERTHAEVPGTAFFYGTPMPVDLLAHFDWVVVEPENIETHELESLQQSGVEVFSYVSIGEVHRSRSWHKDLDPSWFLGTNAAWNSDIVDLRQKGWHSYLLEKRMATLWARGYRGFFLDTLDSYMIGVSDSEKRLQQTKALAALVRSIQKCFPGVQLIFNRGFEILPEVGSTITALAAESIYQGWDPVAGKYKPVTAEAREWLLAKLVDARDKYDIPVIVIDYVSPANRPLARKTAKRIAALGFIPWVTAPDLNYIGMGNIEVVPRLIMIIYDATSMKT